jgi:carbonyl reductase 1
VSFLSLFLDLGGGVGGSARSLQANWVGHFLRWHGKRQKTNAAFIILDNNVVEKTLECNYYGSLEVTQAFLPLIKPTGRLVNVSSTSGKLNRYSDSIRSRFLNAKSVADTTALMEDFKAAVKAREEKERGWPSAAYAVSKAGMTGMTKAIAREERERGGKRLINACCPGWVDTDMTKHRGSKTPDQGAQTPVLLAMGEIGGVSGEYWLDEKVTEW